MKEQEAKVLIAAGAVDEVVLFLRDGVRYEVWLHGERIPSHIKQRLELARGGRRMFASVDSAWRRLRELGWTGRLTIDRCASWGV